MILFLFIFLPFSSIFAFTWTEDEIRQISRSEKITVVSTATKGIETFSVLKDKNGNTFNVINVGTLEKGSVKNILRLKEAFFNWSNLKIDRMKFMVSRKGLDIAVLPLHFAYSNINILPHLPAGMLFSYTDSLYYNFRITKDNLFIKISGDFTGETELCKKIIEAIKDPKEYIIKHDPKYILRQIQRVTKELDEIKKERDLLRWAIIVLITDKSISIQKIDRVVEIKKATPKYNLNQIRLILAKEKIKLSKEQINAILTVYFYQWANL